MHEQWKLVTFNGFPEYLLPKETTAEQADAHCYQVMMTHSSNQELDGETHEGLKANWQTIMVKQFDPSDLLNSA